MDIKTLEKIICEAFDDISSLKPSTTGEVADAIKQTLDLLDKGFLRVAQKKGDDWVVNQWVKKAILLSFRLTPSALIKGGGDAVWWDKIPNKFSNWREQDFMRAQIRAVPNCIVRHSAYLAKNVVLMPSFVNLGAYIDEGTMIDGWATIGSCAQIGKHVHISGGVGIGGVLEPLQSNPTIIEDHCFIGARSEIAEGVIVREGSVLAMGVFLSQSTKIIDRNSGKQFMGEVPPYSVVVSGSLPQALNKPALACAVIVKRVDKKTRSKTSINDLLRDEKQ